MKIKEFRFISLLIFFFLIQGYIGLFISGVYVVMISPNLYINTFVSTYELKVSATGKWSYISKSNQRKDPQCTCLPTFFIQELERIIMLKWNWIIKKAQILKEESGLLVGWLVGWLFIRHVNSCWIILCRNPFKSHKLQIYTVQKVSLQSS